MSGSGLKSLPALSDVREKSEGPSGCLELGGSRPECPGVDERPSRETRSGRKSIPDVRGTSWMSGSGQESLPVVQLLSGGPPR